MPMKLCLNCDEPFTFINANKVFCTPQCQRKKQWKDEKEKLGKCAVCKRIKYEKGEEYPYLCKSCELLAFNGDYEQEIKKETRYS